MGRKRAERRRSRAELELQCFEQAERIVWLEAQVRAMLASPKYDKGAERPVLVNSAMALSMNVPAMPPQPEHFASGCFVVGINGPAMMPLRANVGD